MFLHEIQQREQRLNQVRSTPRQMSVLLTRAINTGKVGIRGKSLLFNDDFKHETLFLAQELDISERFCAHLLDHVMIREPNLGRSATAEKAVLVFHEERRAKLACLRLILEKAFPEEGDSVRPGTSEMLQKYALDLLDANYQMGKDSKTKGRLAVKTLLEIDNIKSTISKQVSALQSALGTADPYAAQLQPSTSLSLPTHSRILTTQTH
jgi:nuclear pore complex protein Nup205